MDMEDEVLLMWENDASFPGFDVAASSVGSYSDNHKSNSNGKTFFKQIDDDLDYAFALSLQTQYEEELKENEDNNSKKHVANISDKSKPLSIVDEQWELIDPHPDIHALFIEYDSKFFYGKLKGVEVKWSPRMTLCAGVCSYEGRGGFCSIRLSVPLLKLRPRRDLVETLIHEMIHAYLFVTHNNKDREGHGPEFLSHMHRINKETGTRISVYHSFHDEVDLYRQHWWKCDGPCQKRRPFFGIVRRAMNRVPGPNDNWWADHQSSCGGKFIKIKEPEDFGKKKTTKRKISSASESKGSDIRSFFKDNSASSSSDNSNSAVKSSRISDLKSISEEKNVANVNPAKTLTKNFIPFQGTGVKLGGFSGGVVHNKNNLSGNPFRKVLDISHSKTPKLPRISNSSDSRDVQKGLPASSTSASPKKLIQSPMKKFLTSNIAVDNSSDVQKNSNQPNVHKIIQRCNTSKVPCPVCFIKIAEEDINSHLDNCLNS